MTSPDIKILNNTEYQTPNAGERVDYECLCDLYFKIWELLPKQIGDWITEKRESLEPGDDEPEFEVCLLSKNFLQTILDYACEDIGALHERFSIPTERQPHFRKPLRLTVRELFFHVLVKHAISFRRAESYRFLDLLVYASKSYVQDGIEKFAPVTDIRLSTLMGHRFDGEVYSFSEINISPIIMRSSNLKFFQRVVNVSRYLERKEVLYIDYPQYFETINGEELVKPMTLKELHRFHNKNKKDCSYHSNLWLGNEMYKRAHPNCVMAILSFIKFKLEDSPSPSQSICSREALM